MHPDLRAANQHARVGTTDRLLSQHDLVCLAVTYTLHKQTFYGNHPYNHQFLAERASIYNKTPLREGVLRLANKIGTVDAHTIVGRAVNHPVQNQVFQPRDTAQQPRIQR
jgi:hypothetical protein